ncbi:hypothetical protein AB1Y20_020468 [Prymnesium parvum]|uniref:Uncharacterized protein n=1 Tax=Prymnesium parvum TaxID=97485 RepID=A0AB34JUN7_PRYPA
MAPGEDAGKGTLKLSEKDQQRFDEFLAKERKRKENVFVERGPVPVVRNFYREGLEDDKLVPAAQTDFGAEQVKLYQRWKVKHGDTQSLLTHMLEDKGHKVTVAK